jgi:hypothetical protein
LRGRLDADQDRSPEGAKNFSATRIARRGPAGESTQTGDLFVKELAA